MRGYDSSIGQRQVSITWAPPGRRQHSTLCSSQSKALDDIFLPFPPSSAGGTTQALCPAGMHHSWRGRPRVLERGTPDNEGAESCVRGECLGRHRDMKPHCMESLLAPAVNPPLDPAHISYYEIRPWRAESASQWSGTI